MPGPTHLKMTVRGTLVPGEVWSNTIAIAQTPNQIITDIDTLTTLGQACIFLWNTGLFTTTNVAAESTTLDECIVRQYDDGLLVAQASASPEDPIAGPSTLQLPPQVSVVLSIQTLTPGGTGRGRVYLPALALQPDTTGHIATGSVTSILGSFNSGLTTFETTIRDVADDAEMNLAVYSAKGAGAVHNATAIRIGNVFDTQRRRRDALVEAYQSTAV